MGRFGWVVSVKGESMRQFVGLMGVLAVAFVMLPAEAKGEPKLAEYRREKNVRSIDGLPAPLG